MNREAYVKNYYAENYSTGHAMDHGRRVIVPDDVVRLSEHTPCTYCGVRPDVLCRHRRWVA